MTRAYELAVVITPDLTDAEIERYLHTFRQLLEKNEVKILEEESWGRRPLAYRIEKKTEGFYLFLKVEMESTKVSTLDQALRLDHNILRHLMILFEEGVEVPVEIKETDTRESRDSRDTRDNK
jgi:small subunit ribosomal protein S6